MQLAKGIRMTRNHFLSKEEDQRKNCSALNQEEKLCTDNTKKAAAFNDIFCMSLQ